MVPYTGISSAARVNAWRFRCTCFRTSRSASSAPFLSNLLMATKSAKSSMSIFSSWLAGPNPGVIPYRDASTGGTFPRPPRPRPPRDRSGGGGGDAQPLALVEPEATHQLVGERGLARAAGAGDAEHR